jgi:hypothetical protein
MCCALRASFVVLLVPFVMLGACASDSPGTPPFDAGDGVDGGLDAGPLPDAGPGDAGADAFVPPDEPWTFIVLPDTQYLSESYPEIFEEQTRWIVAEREALNIQFVLHCGDIVDNNNETQWDAAYAALQILDGEVPYVLAPGNHDLGDNGSANNRNTMLSTYFPVSTFETLPSFGGTFEPDEMDDSYHVFDTPDGPWLVVALEFGPRDAVVTWADEVVRRHAMRTVIVTHAYMYSDDTRYDWATRGTDQMWNPHSYGLASLPGGVNDAEEMFQAFVRQNDEVDLVVSGHVLNDGLGRLTSDQDGGGRVHQVLANYQFQPMGGAGFLRIMTVSADGTEIAVRTYSPYLDEHKTDPDNEFTLPL